MENQPIIFGRDITTNAITQIRTLGNTLLTTAGNLNNLDDVVITSATTDDILKYNGTNWVNSTQNIVKQYITINMFGTTTTNLHANTQPKPIMAGISAYWQATIPNPATNTNASMTSTITPFSDIFDTTTGFITLVSTKRYMITATINQGGVNLNASTQAQLSIYNASSGTASPFTPNYANIGRMDIDFAGMGITTTAVVSGVSKIAIMFNYLTAQTTGLNPFDTSIAVSILEI